MYISLREHTRSSLTYLHGFQLFVRLPLFIEIFFFFFFYEKDKYSASDRQASNHCKRVLEAVKLAYANQAKESITSQKLGSCVFRQIANSVLSEGKSAIPPLLNDLEILSSACERARLFA